MSGYPTNQASGIAFGFPIIRPESMPCAEITSYKPTYLRLYISRVENDHTVPSVETLEKFARALEVPLYVLFYDGEEPPKPPKLLKRKGGANHLWGNSGKDRLALTQFRRLLARINDKDQRLLMFVASKMVLRKAKR